MITSIEKQYRHILGLSICFPTLVLSTENSNSEQILLNKQFGAEQKTALHSKRGTSLLFFLYGRQIAQSTPRCRGEGRQDYKVRRVYAMHTKSCK